MKLSKRLAAIDQMITQHYDHIFDCCCDHGLLGMQLLKRQAADMIYFNDIAQPLIDSLKAILIQNAKNTNWQTHCLDVSQINLPKHGKSLVIIAGVGGDKVIDFVKAITHNNSSVNFELLLCPVHHHYRVRKALIDLNFRLCQELLIKDNRRFYEILHISFEAPQKLSSIGNSMWDYSSLTHFEYYKQVLKHYQQQSLDPKKQVDKIIKAYLTLDKSFQKYFNK